MFLRVHFSRCRLHITEHPYKRISTLFPSERWRKFLDISGIKKWNKPKHCSVRVVNKAVWSLRVITRPTQAVVDEKIVTAAWVGTSASVWQVVYWSDSEAQYGFQGVHMSKRLPNYPLVALSICSPPPTSSRLSCSLPRRPRWLPDDQSSSKFVNSS